MANDPSPKNAGEPHSIAPTVVTGDSEAAEGVVVLKHLRGDTAKQRPGLQAVEAAMGSG